MELKCSLLCLQETADGSYINSAHVLTPYLLRFHFNIILPVYVYVFREVSLL
jgi:hypothetical protein